MQNPIDSAMLIDDSEIDLFIHRRYLELCNFTRELTSFRSAESALERLRNLQGTPPPDVIFLDLNMPVVDGFCFLKLFSTLPDDIQRSVRIVVVTSSNSISDREQVFLHKNVVRMITKPITPSDIEELRTLVAG